MTTKVTEGIRISVSTSYQELYSSANQFQYLFSYTIRIENKNNYSVQLLRRHWHIFDSSGEYREVEGAGVVGETPVIGSGDHYTYESACNLSTDVGKMEGTYLMQRLDTKEKFLVTIPGFKLVAPFRLN